MANHRCYPAFDRGNRRRNSPIAWPAAGARHLTRHADTQDPQLILASASPVRARLLVEAGVAIQIQASTVDENLIKQSGAAEHKSVEEITAELAVAKARQVATKNPHIYVIGADQILECEGRLFDKPPTMKSAAQNLQYLSGRMHRLVTAACVVRDNETVWHCQTEARLSMRDLNDTSIDLYLDRAGEDILGSVGAYRLEGLGANLFEKIEGDYFTILGLPLLPLLSFLREQGLAQR